MADPVKRFIPRAASGALALAALALTLGTAACSSNASAQNAGATQTDAGAPSPGASGAPGARGGNRRMAQVLQSLGLSDDQKEQIRKIMADARSQARTETDPDARRATMRAAFAKVQDVLTPAQRDAFKAKMQALRNGGA
jgi:Spy/CpxP family protein refolding chaperone